QCLERLLALVDSFGAIGPIGDVGLRQRGIEAAEQQLLEILHRALRRLRGGDEPRHAAGAAAVAGARAGRVADRVGEDGADRIVGAAGGAGADAEIADVVFLRARGPAECCESTHPGSRCQEPAPRPDTRHGRHYPVLPVNTGFAASSAPLLSAPLVAASDSLTLNHDTHGARSRVDGCQRKAKNVANSPQFGRFRAAGARVSERADCVVVGAGVVGLAVARRLALAGREVVVLEAADAIGTETSSRNSEVIHAGIYYPTGSLKARLCVAGKEFLYRYCAERGIEHRRCGKLIVATSPAQTTQLERIRLQAAA